MPSKTQKKRKPATNTRRPTRATPKAQSRGLATGVVWLMMGLALGVGIAGFMLWKSSASHLLEKNNMALSKVTPAPKATPKTKPTPTPKVSAKPEKPKFDFYTLLPKMKVDTSNHPKRAETKSALQGAPSLTPHEGNYVVQIASFRKFKDAERLRASLALQGFEASVTQSKHGDNIWNRVFLGPYENKKSASSARLALKQMGMDSLVVRSSNRG